MSLATIDIAMLVAYAIGIFVLAQWVSREKSGEKKDTTDYFLAGKSLPWWAIGASLIAANISAEQIIGMSGSRSPAWIRCTRSSRSARSRSRINCTAG